MNHHQQVTLAVALLCASHCAMAEDTTALNPSLYVQPSINAFRPDTDFGLTRSDKPLGYGGGLKLGKALSEHWDVQTGYVYGRYSHRGQRVQQHLLGVDGLYLFSRDTFRPFLLIGVGAEHDRINLGSGSGGRNSNTSAYVSAGAGFQAVLTDRMSLQMDLRNVHGFGGDKKFKNQKIDNVYLTVGLNIAFDAPPSPAPAAPPPAAPMVYTPPEPIAPPPPPPLPPRFEKVSLSATELFSFDSDKLAASQPKLDDMAKLLNDTPVIEKVAITGYADRLGNAKYNQKLSERRANAVKDYLVSKGVAASRLTAMGKGIANPVVECNEKNRAALIKCLEPNRRVEVEQITVERRVQ